jgi:hypothetical protein
MIEKIRPLLKDFLKFLLFDAITTVVMTLLVIHFVVA